MKAKLAAVVVASWLACCPGLRAGEPFTQESAILALTREDQTKALKTRMLKKEVTVSEVIAVLTSFNKVTREQYLTCDHQASGVRGTVTLKDGKTYTWEIEPGYAATVTDRKGEKTYLLHPNLTVKPEEAGDGKQAKTGEEHRYTAYWLTAEKDSEKSYNVLLLTRLPLAELVQWVRLEESLGPLRTKAPPLLEHVALTMRTYGKDSIWNEDGQPIRPLTRFRDLNDKQRTVEVDGVRYRYEECPVPEVVRLLKFPLGKEPIHRIHAPLSGMEQTARALRLLLEEQLREDESKKK
jgi:hypothetical protein